MDGSGFWNLAAWVLILLSVSKFFGFHRVKNLVNSGALENIDVAPRIVPVFCIIIYSIDDNNNGQEYYERYMAQLQGSHYYHKNHFERLKAWRRYLHVKFMHAYIHAWYVCRACALKLSSLQ